MGLRLRLRPSLGLHLRFLFGFRPGLRLRLEHFFRLVECLGIGACLLLRFRFCGGFGLGLGSCLGFKSLQLFRFSLKFLFGVRSGLCLGLSPGFSLSPLLGFDSRLPFRSGSRFNFGFELLFRRRERLGFSLGLSFCFGPASSFRVGFLLSTRTCFYFRFEFLFRFEQRFSIILCLLLLDSQSRRLSLNTFTLLGLGLELFLGLPPCCGLRLGLFFRPYPPLSLLFRLLLGS